MGSESIECISSSSDGIHEDEIQPHPPLFNIHSQFSSSAKPSHNINVFTNHTNNNNNNNAPLIPPSTSVHELLECPVCTNSMYPPIHQVCSFLNFTFWVSIISVLLFSFLKFIIFRLGYFYVSTHSIITIFSIFFVGMFFALWDLLPIVTQKSALCEQF